MATYKGYFKPLNPHKYKGDTSNIVYRSRWEFVYMARLDKDPDVIWWQSEETTIPYRSPVDNRIHRYYPDFVVRKKTKEGSKTIIIEIKPYAQTLPPTITEGKRKSRKYVNEVMTWGVNSAKWKAAREFCKDRGYEFVIITEKELGLMF
jgi:hypothetical protein